MSLSKSNNPLFDALGIDESAGIDTDEVEALKRALERIKVEAAQVAKVNDTATTKELLEAMVTVVRKVGTVTSVNELHQVLATLGSGSTAMAVAPATSVSTSDNDTLTDNERRLVELFRNSPTGQQQGIIRIMNAGDPSHIRVDSTGTPVMIGQLQQALDNDHDVNYGGSQAAIIHDLQQQLAARALPTGTAMVPKADLDAVQANLTTAQANLGALKSSVKTEVAKLELDNAEPGGFGGKKTTLVVAPTVVRGVARELDVLTR